MPHFAILSMFTACACDGLTRLVGRLHDKPRLLLNGKKGLPHG
jgi:hypothetical protein